MKFFITLIISFLVTTVVPAQVKLDVVISPQINESLGARLGSNLNIPINSRWSFMPGVYWSLRNRLGTESSTYNGIKKETEYSDHAHFVTLPLRLGLQMPCKDEDRLAIKLFFGPYIAYGICGTSKSTVNTGGLETKYEVGAFDSNGRYKDRLDYGLNYGLNILINQHYTVGIFKEFGFRKIYNTNNVIEDIVGEIFLINKINFALGLSLGYQF